MNNNFNDLFRKYYGFRVQDGTAYGYSKKPHELASYVWIFWLLPAFSWVVLNGMLESRTIVIAVCVQTFVIILAMWFVREKMFTFEETRLGVPAHEFQEVLDATDCSVETINGNSVFVPKND